jgi:hypothetical protein
LTVPSYAKIDPKTAVGAWTLDEGSGNIVKDSSGNKNDGTLTDAPKWVGGHSGNALEFSGAAGYVNCGNAASLNITKTITVMGWVKPNAIGKWQRFASRGEYNTGWMIGITDAGKPDLTVTNSSGGFLTMYGKATLEIGKWYHIAGVTDSDGKKAYIYLNGVLDNDPVAYSGEMMNPNVPTVIGKSWGLAAAGDNSYIFNGIVDEVAIFNVAIAGDDIKNLMNNGINTAAVSPSGKSAITWGEIKAK